MKPKDIFLLLLLAAIWGSSYLFLRIVTPAIGVPMTLATRIILAAIVMVALFAYLKKLPDYKRFWKQYFVLGLLNLILPFGLSAYSITNLNASMGAILNATTPLFTMIISSLWLKEKMDYKKVAGLFTGIAGLTVLVGWMPFAVTGKVVISILFSLLAALSYGIGAVYTRAYLKNSEPLKTSTGQLSAAALLAVPLIGYTSAGEAVNYEIAIAVVFLAVLSTAIGYTLYFKLIANIGSTNASLVTLLVPVFSLLWGLIFLNEPLTPSLIIGLTLILGSLKLVLPSAHKCSLFSGAAISGK
jgi:drug/metabolite transporter (DMT)-like permease